MKFLLIDDDDEDATIFCEALTDIDATILCDHERNPLHAVGRVCQAVPGIDLIFLDLNMPVLDGWELLKILKSHPELMTIPVIIYSTSPLERDIARARNMGAAFYFAKPMDFIALRVQLQRIIVAFERHGLDQIEVKL